MWVHAHEARDPGPVVDAARRGAWVSLDGYRPDRHARFLELLGVLRDRGCLGRVLLSHDGNSYPRRGAAPPRPALDLLTTLLPALAASGGADDVRRCTVDNPARAFAVGARRA